MTIDINRIRSFGVVPVVVIESAADAPALVDALKRGGLPVAEITFRTPAAVDAIRAASGAHPDVLIGAGSVLLADQVDAASDAGARFVVSPGLDEVVVERTLALDILSLPGCATASDLMRARRLGLSCVKFFPAEALGGIEMLKAVAAPFPGLQYVPTGGINVRNLRTYLEDSRVVAVGGSWMVPPALVAGRDWQAISALAREAVDSIARIREGRQ